MKAEEWLTYFIKIYGRRPKMTEVDEAIQNGSLLANRAEVEALLPTSKKGFWEGRSVSPCNFLYDASRWWSHLCLALSQLTNLNNTIFRSSFI